MATLGDDTEEAIPTVDAIANQVAIFRDSEGDLGDLVTAIKEMQVDNHTTSGTSIHDKAYSEEQETSPADNSVEILSIGGTLEENCQEIDKKLKSLFLDVGNFIYTKELFLILPKNYHKTVTNLILKTTLNNEVYPSKLLELICIRLCTYPTKSILKRAMAES